MTQPDPSFPSPRPLPPNASLVHLRKQAKRLAAESSSLKLAEAQFRLARSYGFASWPKLVMHFEKLKPSAGDRDDASQGYATGERPGPDLWPIKRRDILALAPALEAGDVGALVALFEEDNSRGDPVAYWFRRDLGEAVPRFLMRYADRLTPHLAAAFGEADVLRRMLEADPSVVHTTDTRGRTPLDFAAHEGHTACVGLLLSAGADPDAKQPLFHAAQNGYLEPARRLFDAGANPNHPKESPLGRATYRNRPRMVQLLLDHGAELEPDIIAGAAYGSRTAGKLHILQMLIDRGADVRYRRPTGFNALYTQIWYYGPGPDPDITDFLIDAGCPLDLHAAAGLDRAEELAEMLDAEPNRVNERFGDQDWTPLHFAAWGGAHASARLLLERGADPNRLAKGEAHDAKRDQRLTPLELVRHPDGHYLTRPTEALARLLRDAMADPPPA